MKSNFIEEKIYSPAPVADASAQIARTSARTANVPALIVCAPARDIRAPARDVGAPARGACAPARFVCAPAQGTCTSARGLYPMKSINLATKELRELLSQSTLIIKAAVPQERWVDFGISAKK